MGKSISDLQWSHETMIRLIEVVQHNALVSERLSECTVAIGKAVVLLEGLIQEHLAHARRRRDD